MADNYLEQRMEDMRSGKIASSNHKLASIQKNISGISSKSLRLRGIRAVVTGGAGLIGSEIVRQLRKEGASVDILDIDRKKGALIAQNTGSRFYPVDLSDIESFDSVINDILKRRGDIDIIINCGAKIDFIDLCDNTAERFEKSWKTNVLPAFESARLLALHRSSLPEPNKYGGRIINICSTRVWQSEEATENYSATKGALFALTHSLMMSLSKFGITVNSISPGWIASENENFSDNDHRQHPSLRVGKPSDIASMCVYICNPSNNFINGEDIRIDGGMSHKMIYSE